MVFLVVVRKNKWFELIGELVRDPLPSGIVLARICTAYLIIWKTVDAFRDGYVLRSHSIFRS